jgi:hypothetical protein
MSTRRNWDSPNPSPASECALPHGPKSGGHIACAKGVGESKLRRLEKKLSTLPILCGENQWLFVDRCWCENCKELAAKEITLTNKRQKLKRQKEKITPKIIICGDIGVAACYSLRVKS